MTANDFFNTVLPAKLASSPQSFRVVFAEIQVNVTAGGGGSSWHINLKSDPPTCVVGSSAADATLEMDEEVADNLVSGGTDFFRLDNRRKLTITGKKAVLARFFRFVLGM